MKWYVDGHSGCSAAVAHGPLPACVPLIYVDRKHRRGLLGHALSRHVGTTRRSHSCNRESRESPHMKR